MEVVLGVDLQFVTLLFRGVMNVPVWQEAMSGNGVGFWSGKYMSYCHVETE